MKSAAIYRKRSKSEMIFDFCNVLILFFFTFTCIYPFYYIFIYSISDPIQATKGILFWPVGVTLDNYARVFALRGMGMAAAVTVSVTILSTLLSMFANGVVGYLLSRRAMPFRRFIYRAFVVTMYISGGLIPNFILMRQLHLYDTYWIYILPSIMNAYYMILIKTYVESIPEALEESAKLDGASYWTIIIRIILPLSIPILATIGVFNAVGKWSDYSTTLIYTISNDLRTLQYILYQYLKSASKLLLEEGASGGVGRKITPTSIKMTLVVITVVPILCVYPFLQRYFVKGIMLGAVKG